MSASLMQLAMASTGWLSSAGESGVEFIFIDAPFATALNPDSMELEEVVKGKYSKASSYFGWGELRRMQTLDAGLKHVHEAVAAHAPIMAIGGMSSGSLVAAAYAKQHPGMSALLNISSPAWEWLPAKFRAGAIFSMPSLHVLGTDDAILTPAQLQSLPRRCTRRQYLRHSGGHTLPLLDATSRHVVVKFLCVVSGSIAEDDFEHVEVEDIARSQLHDMTSRTGDAFLWRKLIERQRRWFEHDDSGQPVRDECNRFVPSRFNPLPRLNPLDKLAERSFFEELGIPLPKLLATIELPNDLIGLWDTLPQSGWVIKPVGAAYSNGVTVVRSGVDVFSGKPVDMRRVIARLIALKRRGGRPSYLDSPDGSQRRQQQHLLWNTSSFLIEELVIDEHDMAPPTDYRVRAHVTLP